MLLGVWALFQNFFKIGTAPILADEPGYVTTGWSYLHQTFPSPPAHTGSLVAVPGNFEHPPLAKYLFALAQLASGTPRDLTASRCVSATATVLVGVVVGLWLARLTDRWTALSAFGLLTVLPQPAGGSDGRFGRFAMLDPVASLFMVLSVVAAWEWSRRRGRPAFGCAVLAGLAIALAAGAKENGALGAVGPVLLVVAVALRTREAALIRARLLELSVAMTVAVAGFAALYLPISNPIDAIGYLVSFQTTQSSNGHLVGFAGQVATRPPWWTNLWYAGHGYGAALTAFIVCAALYAVAARRDLLAGWCVAALAVPFVFHCFVAHVVLGYYWVMWSPLVLTLAALGVSDIVGRAARIEWSRARRVQGFPLRIPDVRGPVFRGAVVTATAAAVLAVPVVRSVGDTVDTAEIHPQGAEVLPSLLTDDGLTGPIVSTGIGAWAYAYYLPSVKVSTAVDASSTRANAIVVAAPQCRDPLDAGVRALVAVNKAAGDVRQIYSDPTIRIYAVVGPLRLPSAAQIAAEPISRATDGC